jgi:hypothetical protein
VDNVRQPTLAGTSAQGFGSEGSVQEAPGGSVMILSRAAGTDGQVAAVINSISIPDAGMTKILLRVTINNPTWFKAFPINVGGTPTLHYLLADANGCYELEPHHVDGNTIDDTNPQQNELVVVWMITDDDYYYLTGRHLQAASIERLNKADIYTNVNGKINFAPHYLITNGYSGPDNVVDPDAFNNPPNVARGEIHGEVFEIRGRDYYDQPGTQTPSADGSGAYNGYSRSANATNQPIRFYTLDGNGNLIRNPQTLNTPGSAIVSMIPNDQPQITGTKLPIQRKIGTYDNSTASYTLQQPKFSDRPF